MSSIPDHILRRSAEARAKAEGRTVEEVLAEMKGETPPPAAEEPAPAAPATPAPAATPSPAASGLPDHILRRSAEARAKREGRSVEEVLAEMKGETPPPAAEEPAPAAPATPAPAATPSPAASGLPDHILRRSAEARAKAEGRTVEEVLAEMKGEAPPTTASPAAAEQPAVAAAAPAAAVAAAPVIPEGVRTQRLLTVVKAGAIQQVKTEPTDKVNVWPHLLAIEFVALIVCTGVLVVFSAFVDAPLLEFANFNAQPNPSKAPWYFLGLQEMLSYFDPQVAGVIIPGFGLAGLAIIPYIDKNPSVRPSDRKLAIMIFSFFFFASAILTIYGSFFRGPGFNFTYPWIDGVFFDF